MKSTFRKGLNENRQEITVLQIFLLFFIFVIVSLSGLKKPVFGSVPSYKTVEVENKLSEKVWKFKHQKVKFLIPCEKIKSDVLERLLKMYPDITEEEKAEILKKLERSLRYYLKEDDKIFFTPALSCEDRENILIEHIKNALSKMKWVETEATFYLDPSGRLGEGKASVTREDRFFLHKKAQWEVYSKSDRGTITALGVFRIANLECTPDTLSLELKLDRITYTVPVFFLGPKVKVMIDWSSIERDLDSLPKEIIADGKDIYEKSITDFVKEIESILTNRFKESYQTYSFKIEKTYGIPPEVVISRIQRAFPSLYYYDPKESSFILNGYLSVGKRYTLSSLIVDEKGKKHYAIYNPEPFQTRVTLVFKVFPEVNARSAVVYEVIYHSVRDNLFERDVDVKSYVEKFLSQQIFMIESAIKK